MKILNIDFDAEWKPDCSGKYDFDFPVVRVSTRYWPDNTAKVTIYLGNETLISHEGYIHGYSEIDCKNNVEMYIKRKVEEIIKRIMFKNIPAETPRPQIITLCGSTKFKDAFIDVQK